MTTLACLDPDPNSQSETGSARPFESGSNPDPKNWNKLQYSLSWTGYLGVAHSCLPVKYFVQGVPHCFPIQYTRYISEAPDTTIYYHVHCTQPTGQDVHPRCSTKLTCTFCTKSSSIWGSFTLLICTTIEIVTQLTCTICMSVQSERNQARTWTR